MTFQRKTISVSATRINIMSSPIQCIVVSLPSSPVTFNSAETLAESPLVKQCSVLLERCDGKPHVDALPFRDTTEESDDNGVFCQEEWEREVERRCKEELLRDSDYGSDVSLEELLCEEEMQFSSDDGGGISGSPRPESDPFAGIEKARARGEQLPGEQGEGETEEDGPEERVNLSLEEFDTL